MNKLVLVLSAFSILAVGCGKNSVHSKNATDSALTGVWLSPCESQSALEAGTSTFTFSEIGEVTVIDETYPNQGCQGAPTKTEKTSAIYNVTTVSTTAEGARTISVKLTNFQVPSSTLTVDSRKIEFGITSKDQIEMKILETIATDQATGKTITSAAVDPATTLTRKK